MTGKPKRQMDLIRRALAIHEALYQSNPSERSARPGVASGCGRLRSPNPMPETGRNSGLRRRLLAIYKEIARSGTREFTPSATSRLVINTMAIQGKLRQYAESLRVIRPRWPSIRLAWRRTLQHGSQDGCVV
jgi:hypothetical protein